MISVDTLALLNLEADTRRLLSALDQFRRHRKPLSPETIRRAEQLLSCLQEALAEGEDESVAIGGFSASDDQIDASLYFAKMALRDAGLPHDDDAMKLLLRRLRAALRPQEPPKISALKEFSEFLRSYHKSLELYAGV